LTLFLKIVGGIVALALGVYWGLAGTYTSDPEEIDRALGPGGRTRKVKRTFTPLGWLRGRVESPSRARRTAGANRRFDFVAPGSKDEDPPEIKLRK
jgi:hypothetical protein